MQILALPAVIVVLSQSPQLVPTALAAIGGRPFLPRLHRSRFYVFLGTAISLGSFIITLLVDANDHRWVLTWWAGLYALAVVYLLRLHRRRSRLAPPTTR